MPFAYVAAGWLVAAINPGRRWVSTVLMSVASGVSHPVFDYAFETPSGGQPHIWSVPEAALWVWQMALITLVLASIGCAIAMATWRKTRLEPGA